MGQTDPQLTPLSAIFFINFPTIYFMFLLLVESATIKTPCVIGPSFREIGKFQLQLAEKIILKTTRLFPETSHHGSFTRCSPR